MGKYEALTHYLENQPEEIWEARFSDVERVLGFPLPRSAHEYPAWWANQEPGHSQTRGWRDAGWETGQVDLSAKKVRFRRRLNSGVASPGSLTRTDQKELWQKATRITGIEDRGALLEKALQALIRQETARYFAEIGGTMPDYEAAPRERPFA
jgi:hypothetical protein